MKTFILLLSFFIGAEVFAQGTTEKINPGFPSITAWSPVIPGCNFTELDGFYDYMSNGAATRFIVNSRANPNHINACVFEMIGDTTADVQASVARRTLYSYSDDGGMTWNKDPQTIPNNLRSGFPWMLSLADGRVVIVNHVGASSGSSTFTNAFVNSFEGDISFQGSEASGTDGEGNTLSIIWPSAVATSLTKGVIAATINGTPQDPLQIADMDISASTVTIGPWRTSNPAANTSGGRSPMAISPSGKIGIGYYDIATGDIVLMESVNAGATWSNPEVLFANGTVVNGDTIVNSGSIDIMYAGETPHIVFNAAVTTLDNARIYDVSKSPAGGIQLSLVAKRGGDVCIGIDDYPANFQGLSNMALMAYPTLGRSSNGQMMFTLFQAVKKGLYKTDGTKDFFYYQIWCSASTNNGASWSQALLIQPSVIGSDTFSFFYPSLSKELAVNGSSGATKLSMGFMTKKGPGLFSLNGTGTGNPTPTPTRTWLFYKSQDVTTTSFDWTPLDVRDQATTDEKDFTLGQNYPNPFSVSTDIQYSLSKAASVVLEVSDMLGRVVERKALGTQTPGVHEVTLNASGLDAGIYSYRMMVNGVTSAVNHFTVVK